MDDGSKTVDLPFTFRFYGEDYNHLTMCSNGWISLLPTDMVDFYNHYIPAALGPYAMIAGYWDDLKGMKTGVNSFNDMRVIYWHDVANNRYIVQWNDAYNQYTIDMMENASWKNSRSSSTRQNWDGISSSNTTLWTTPHHHQLLHRGHRG